MMKLQGLIATMRSLFGGRRLTFGFVVLPFFGVVLFPSPAMSRPDSRSYSIGESEPSPGSDTIYLGLFTCFFFFFFELNLYLWVYKQFL